MKVNEKPKNVLSIILIIKMSKQFGPKNKVRKTSNITSNKHDVVVTSSNNNNNNAIINPRNDNTVGLINSNNNNAGRQNNNNNDFGNRLYNHHTVGTLARRILVETKRGTTIQENKPASSSSSSSLAAAKTINNNKFLTNQNTNNNDKLLSTNNISTRFATRTTRSNTVSLTTNRNNNNQVINSNNRAFSSSNQSNKRKISAIGNNNENNTPFLNSLREDIEDIVNKLESLSINKMDFIRKIFKDNKVKKDLVTIRDYINHANSIIQSDYLFTVATLKTKTYEMIRNYQKCHDKLINSKFTQCRKDNKYLVLLYNIKISDYNDSLMQQINYNNKLKNLQEKCMVEEIDYNELSDLIINHKISMHHKRINFNLENFNKNEKMMLFINPITCKIMEIYNDIKFDM